MTDSLSACFCGSSSTLLSLAILCRASRPSCVWGVMGALMDREHMLWMKVVREWIGSVDEGPVMMDSIITFGWSLKEEGFKETSVN